jgi:hypothetical protein
MDEPLIRPGFDRMLYDTLFPNAPDPIAMAWRFFYDLRVRSPRPGVTPIGISFRDTGVWRLERLELGGGASATLAQLLDWSPAGGWPSWERR